MMADTISAERRSWNMSRIKARDTKPEMLLRSLLHREGFRFRLHAKNLPGKPDIVLPRYKTVIFVHGCFWHRHSECKNATMPSTRREFWEEKFNGNIRRDALNRLVLEEAGWNVFVVWECELKASASQVVEKLSRTIRGN
jgi:DNA mismatch endonuclease (patch repair protein)